MYVRKGIYIEPEGKKSHLDDRFHRESCCPEALVDLSPAIQSISQSKPIRPRRGSSYRGVVGLEELAEGVDRRRVHPEATEEVGEVLVPHDRQNHLERACLESRIGGARESTASDVS